jgi:hypothetical protein
VPSEPTSAPTSFGSEPTSFGSEPTSFGSEPTSFGSEPTSFGSEPGQIGYEIGEIAPTYIEIAIGIAEIAAPAHGWYPPSRNGQGPGRAGPGCPPPASACKPGSAARDAGGDEARARPSARPALRVCSRPMHLRGLVTVGSLVLGVAACGGNVVVDLGGNGGASTTATATTGTGGADLCGQACGALVARGCAGAGCVAACEGVLSGACSDAATSLLSCLRDQAAGASSCFIDACMASRDALQACAAQGSCDSPVFGTGGPDVCVGKGICAAVERAVSCDGSGACSCLLGSGTVGACQEPGPFLCDFADGCCAHVFPEGG